MVSDPETVLDSAIAFHKEGDLDSAIKLYEHLLSLNPEHADANHLLGVALLGRGQNDDRDRMFEFLRRAITIRPDTAAYHNDLGNAFWMKKNFQAAEEEFSRCVDLNPELVRGHFNLGNARFAQRNYSAAISAYSRCLALDYTWDNARYYLGICQYYTGNLDLSIRSLLQVISRQPDNQEAYLALASAYLKRGDYVEGWRCFEHRLLGNRPGFPVEPEDKRWEGQSFPGKTLLVFGEQGIGDVIQFVRYLPMVAELGGRVILTVDESLVDLLRRCLTSIEIIVRSEISGRAKLPKFDFYIPLLSLAKIFYITEKTLLAGVPYLWGDDKKSYLPRTNVNTSRKSVGIVWAGNPAQKDDPSRSCRLSDFHSLSKISWIDCYSFQFGCNLREEKSRLGWPSLRDATADLQSFDDTASVLRSMDLILTVDTATAHLAGAMGLPVWVVLWKGHCWRYLETSEHSPWYPTMRLFRQQRQDDWSSVFKSVINELSSLYQDQFAPDSSALNGSSSSNE